MDPRTKKTYFVDHNRKVTQWEDPRPPITPEQVKTVKKPRRNSNQDPKAEVNPNMDIYEGILCMALADRSISAEEEKLLNQMRLKLNLSEEQHKTSLRNINVNELDWQNYLLKGKAQGESGESSQEKHAECIICMDQMADHILLDCMHLCLCGECAEGITKCPKCRADVKEVRKVFF